MVSALSVQVSPNDVRYVLPAAIPISVPGSLLDWHMFRISPEDCQSPSTISRLVIASFMARCEIPMPALINGVVVWLEMCPKGALAEGEVGSVP